MVNSIIPLLEDLMFKPGDKVRCVNNGIISGARQQPLLELGKLYTIQDIEYALDEERVSLEDFKDKMFKPERFVLVKNTRNLPEWF